MITPPVAGPFLFLGHLLYPTLSTISPTLTSKSYFVPESGFKPAHIGTNERKLKEGG